MPAIERQQIGRRLSQACAYGPTVYLAGQAADDLSADVTAQTEQVLRKVDQLLASAGTDKTMLLSATIWIADMSTFADMNKVWDAWVSFGNTPARACVEAKLAAPQWKVEIAIIALSRIGLDDSFRAFGGLGFTAAPFVFHGGEGGSSSDATPKTQYLVAERPQ
jgi:enamine deaminase RidA (YjgF/YER057c/UK114 family)